LTVDLSDAMWKAVGFRNVLVHEYVAVSDAIVEFRLGDLRDLERFVERVTAFVRDGSAVGPWRHAPRGWRRGGQGS
ncbi:HepT-like ribonuclease domain-containing protein, partial [Mycobacterium sp. Lab-001]|uniref:HepT-like ribonuclease domain-containing protein n=1 Tax=Mycobacterium sp. Lab-001 TaxID=3410136 RepID=UPI003D17EAEF